MNNAQIAIEQSKLELDVDLDDKPMLRSKETELTDIIEAIDVISASPAWKLLENKVLTGVLGALQRKISLEKNPTEMYRLQGQIAWAEKYTDLKKFAQVYRLELQNVRKKLNG